MPTIAQLLEQGFQLHRQGQFAAARQLYEQALAQDPNHADALNLLGFLGWQTGACEEAVQHLRRAIELKPAQAAYYANLGEAYRGLGRYDEAIHSYEQALRLQPAAAVAHLQFGQLLHEAGNLDRAIDSYERALQLDPLRVQTLMRLGTARKQQGNLAAAEDCFRRAVQADPSAAEAYFELGNLQHGAARHDESIASYRQALALRPDYAEAACNLGNALRELQRFDEARATLEHALELRPDLTEAVANLGVTLQDMGRLDEAGVLFARANEMAPNHPDLLLNMATLLKDQGRLHAALDWYERSLQARPGYAEALCGRGVTRLMLGEFTAGWADYESRADCPQFNTLSFPQPMWDGSPLAERRLLVHCEQGFGDTLQFVRYLPMVRARGQHVTLAVQPSLMALLAGSGYGPLVSKEDPLPPFDVHAPLMSLPRILGTTLETIPAEVPYLQVDEARVVRLRDELAKHSGFKIGIAWQGRPNFRRDHLRSIPLEQFAPVAQVEGMRLFNLQVGPGTNQIAALAGKFELHELDLRHDPAFLDIAAAMQSLDLVISSDTAIAHLAGALGVPVWLALSAAPAWRWLRDRDDCPWYPSMRLFRQTQLGQWPDVFERMAAALREKLA